MKQASAATSVAEHRRCARCVIDTTDPGVVFDERGFCNHCRAAEITLRRPPSGASREEKARLLEELVARLRSEGRGHRYDCVIGVSGGVDSTYVALLTKKLGLRALAVHLDNGWDSELAVANIENVLKRLDIDLETYVINWEEFKDLQLAFLKASTPDSEIPTDHAIVSVLYQVALREGIRTIVAGTNYATESIMPLAWSQGHTDWHYIRSLHRQFGRVPLRTYPHRTMWQDIYYRFVRRIRWVSILDYLVYVKQDAKDALSHEAGSARLRRQALRVDLHTLLPDIHPPDEVRLRQAKGPSVGAHHVGTDHAGAGAHGARETAPRSGAARRTIATT